MHLPAEGEEPEEQKTPVPLPEVTLSPILEDNNKKADAASIMTHCKKSAGVPRETMRVSLYPGSALFFQSQSSSHIRRHFLKRQTGPLTRRITQTLTITNNNIRPIAYKVKTTNPKVRRSRDYRAMY